MATRRKPSSTPLSDALSVSVLELRRSERLTTADEALVAVAAGLASLIDVAGGAVDSRYWGQYQAALKALMDRGADDGDDEGISQLIAAIRGDAEVVDS